MHSFFRFGQPFGQALLTQGCCALVGLVLAAGLAVAQTRVDQPAGTQAAGVPPAGTQRGVGEVGPEIFYLEGDGGRLVPVPGFRYRDFVELFRIQEGLPGAVQPPAAVLESLVVRLDTRPEQAADQKTAPNRGECPVVVECTVRQTRGGWVHVPIDLDGLFLSAAAEHDGPGRLVVDTEAVTGGSNAAGAGRRGYRLWFDAALPATGDARHTVVLNGRVATEADAGGLALSLRLPAATTSLVVVATTADGVVTVAPPPPPQRLSTTGGPDGPQTEIAGLIGPVRIRVAARGAAAPPQATVPQASVESLVRIDGHNAFTDATIRLENLPAAMRRVRITLPPRTTLRNVRGSATVAARGGTVERPTIDVTIDRDTAAQTTIELECERPIDPSGREPIELIGFAVADVPLWRQWGRVSLVVEGDWRAEWPAEPGVRRVDPPAAARRPGFVAAFAYDAQPASLPLVVRPRPSRVVIEPDYRYHVAAQRIGMVARFRMSVRGAPVTSLVVEQADLAGESGWAVEDVGPATLVDSAAVTVADGRITIPFLQALGGEAVIELRGSRRLARDADEVAWSLPAPSADLVVPATVAITADSDIEILPDVARSRGLVRQAATGFPRSEADGEAGGLLYRLDAPNGRFVGSRRSLPRRIDATLAVQVDIDETELAVEQLIRLTVVHVPLDAVELLVPEDIAASGTLEVRQDDIVLEPLEDRRSAEAPAAAETTGSRVFRVFPPDPILGRGDLVVRYHLPAPTIRPESTEARLLPFVLPAGARIDRQTLVVESADSLSVDVPDEAWRRDVGPGERARAYVAAKRQDGVRLAIATRPRVASGGTIVEAAWLQTHLLVDRREDLFSYVLAGAGERLVVSVPGGFGDPVARTCDFLLDGTPLPVAVTADGGFTSELPRITSGRRRRLEIRLSGPRAVTLAEQWAAAFRLPTPVRLAAPVFGGRAVQRRFYWEVMARADEHLLARPGTWTSQQRWTWESAGFTAVPVVTTSALADWLQQAVVRSPGQARAPDQATAAPTVVDPPLVERRSVYSGMGNPGDHRLWLVPSWCLVLCCSGAMLAVGLSLAYVPALRRPGVVVPFAAAVVLAAVAAPGLAPLVAQAAVPGVLLVLLAWFLRATFDRSEPGIDLRPDEVAVSASTLTRELSGPPSVVITQSSVARERTTGTSVGSGS
jgi:hypothetical protein